jgi:hypothetical protein
MADDGNPRTSDVAAATELLERKVAGCPRAEVALGEHQRESPLIMDSIPGMVALRPLPATSRSYQGGCRDGFERLAPMLGSSSIMPVTLSSRRPWGVSRSAAVTAGIATIFLTLAGCRMPRRSASMPRRSTPARPRDPSSGGRQRVAA